MTASALFRALVAAGLALTPALRAATVFEPTTLFQASRPSRVVLQGSSNVTEWRCTGTTLNASVEVDASIAKINEVIDRIEDGNIAVWMANPAEGRFPQPRLRMTIPISTLRCGNRVMERDMNRALKAQRHPAIEFRFTELSGAVHHDIDRHLYEAQIAGELSVAGVTRRMTLPVTAQRLARDRFRLRAQLRLRMSDFGITPPTALFGMLRAKNELTVRFDLILQPMTASFVAQSEGAA